MQADGIDIKVFQDFLEKEILNMPILAIKSLPKGATSYNFCIKTANEKFLVKLFTSLLVEADTLLNILKTLKKEQSSLRIPEVKEFNNQALFLWGEYKLIVLGYAEGKTIPSWKLRETHLRQIFQEYNLLWNGLQALKERDFHKIQFATMYDESQQLLKKRIDNSKGLVRYMFCKLKAQLLPPAQFQTALGVIHGDFHNNNILFDGKNLSNILDFGTVHFGNIGEDIARFLLCAQARLPLGIPRYLWMKRSVDIAMNTVSLSPLELQEGINIFLISMTHKSLHKKKGFFKTIKMLISLLYLNYLRDKLKIYVLKKYKN